MNNKIIICRVSYLWILLISFFITSHVLSQTSHKNIIKQVPIYDNKKVGDYVQSILDKIVLANVKSSKKKSKKKQSKYNVYVLDSPDINAFVTPSNKMYINRGLLSYVTSEAELAAILAHELGHIRDRHSLQLKSTKVASAVISTAAAFTTGSNEVGNSVNIFAQAQTSGYGRKLELKADKLAAKYLYNAGYSPSALIDILSLLKNHQRFVKYTAKQQNKLAQSYHGVFATHPRNDTRLKKVVSSAGELPPNENIVGRKSLRNALEGIAFGERAGDTSTDTFIYINRKHGIAVTFDKQWRYMEDTARTVFSSAEQPLILAYDVFRKGTKNCDKQPDAKTNTGLNAHENSYEYIQQPNYFACIQIGTRSFYFQGKNTSNTLTEMQIELFRSILNDFRRVTSRDYKENSNRYIYFQRARPGDTFSSLASNAIVGEYTEQYLRLINGFYPKGEPEPGLWLKLIR